MSVAKDARKALHGRVHLTRVRIAGKRVATTSHPSGIGTKKGRRRTQRSR